jgi:hypothetical protein
MRKNLIGLAILASLFSSTEAFACCSYGCCDCSCVGKKLEKLAPKLDKSAKGGLQSFTVDASVMEAKKSSCQMQDKIATCEKQ